MSGTAQNHWSQPVETVRQFLALAVVQGHGAAARRDTHRRAVAGHTRKAIHVDFATSAVNLREVARKHVWVRHRGRRLHEAAQIGTLRVGVRVGRGGRPVLI